MQSASRSTGPPGVIRSGSHPVRDFINTATHLFQIRLGALEGRWELSRTLAGGERERTPGRSRRRKAVGGTKQNCPLPSAYCLFCPGFASLTRVSRTRDTPSIQAVPLILLSNFQDGWRTTWWIPAQSYLEVCHRLLQALSASLCQLFLRLFQQALVGAQQQVAAQDPLQPRVASEHRVEQNPEGGIDKEQGAKQKQQFPHGATGGKVNPGKACHEFHEFSFASHNLETTDEHG